MSALDSLDRAARRLLAERDAALLRVQGPEDDLDDLVRWTARAELEG